MTDVEGGPRRLAGRGDVSAGGGQQPEETSALGFPMRPPGDGEVIKQGRHHWYELARSTGPSPT